MKKRVILFLMLIGSSSYGQIAQPESVQPINFVGNESSEVLAGKLTGIGRYFSCKFTLRSGARRYSSINNRCEDGRYFFEPSWSPLNTFVGYKNLKNQDELTADYKSCWMGGYQERALELLEQDYNAAGINLDMTSQFFNRFIAFNFHVNSKTWKDSPPISTKNYVIGSKYCMGAGSCDTQIGFFKRLQRCNIQEAMLENRYDSQRCFQKAVNSKWVTAIINSPLFKNSAKFNPEYDHNGNLETRETIVWAFLLAELLKRNGYS